MATMPAASTASILIPSSGFPSMGRAGNCAPTPRTQALEAIVEKKGSSKGGEILQSRALVTQVRTAFPWLRCFQIPVAVSCV